MKFYYLDDSYFRQSSFLMTLFNRLQKLCQTQPVDTIFISGTASNTKTLGSFLSICHKLGIHVIQSPSAFDIDGVKGVLSTTSLNLEGMEWMQCFSGMLWYGDSETNELERIYLEFFLTYDDTITNELTTEIEKALQEIVLKKGTSKNKQWN